MEAQIHHWAKRKMQKGPTAELVGAFTIAFAFSKVHSCAVDIVLSGF